MEAVVFSKSVMEFFFIILGVFKLIFKALLTLAPLRNHRILILQNLRTLALILIIIVPDSFTFRLIPFS